MSRVVDARGLNCPQPVILTKKAMDEGGLEGITTMVDNATALENVKKLAASQGYSVEVEEGEGEYKINMTPSCECSGFIEGKKDDVAILVTSDLFGRGEEELGRVLMKSFLYTLSESGDQIKHLVFMNSGVYLTTEGSLVLDHLSALEGKGVEILSCGTCLDFYGLKEKLAVGRVTNMYTAVEIICGAAKAITL
ncbi:MAG: sulfurtransferase-like selenium metabolism protein YedF [Firmicutes bacterium]|nr:sulfurtransferase-like selenium metabolism protein YedF [Bacillota bacterium]